MSRAGWNKIKQRELHLSGKFLDNHGNIFNEFLKLPFLFYKDNIIENLHHTGKHEEEKN